MRNPAEDKLHVQPIVSTSHGFKQTAWLKVIVGCLAFALVSTINLDVWLRVGLGFLVGLTMFFWIRQSAGSRAGSLTKKVVVAQRPVSPQVQSLLGRAESYEARANDPVLATNDPGGLRRQALLQAAAACRRSANELSRNH
jgi:hypothetical protein